MWPPPALPSAQEREREREGTNLPKLPQQCSFSAGPRILQPFYSRLETVAAAFEAFPRTTRESGRLSDPFPIGKNIAHQNSPPYSPGRPCCKFPPFSSSCMCWGSPAIKMAATACILCLREVHLQRGAKKAFFFFFFLLGQLHPRPWPYLVPFSLSLSPAAAANPRSKKPARPPHCAPLMIQCGLSHKFGSSSRRRETLTAAKGSKEPKGHVNKANPKTCCLLAYCEAAQAIISRLRTRSLMPCSRHPCSM